MQIVAPVTDYIPASLLTTLGDMVMRGAAQPERQPGILKAIGVYVNNFQRNAGGDHVIATVGFQPACVIFIGVDSNNANLNRSFGFDDGTVHRCIRVYNAGNNNSMDTLRSIYMEGLVGNSLIGYISAMGADGFTITWVLAGAMTANIIYICLP